MVTCCFPGIADAIETMQKQKTRKLVNNGPQSLQLPSTNVEVNVHLHLVLEIALPVVGGVILSILGWAVYKLRDMKAGTKPAEDAHVVAANRSNPEAEDIVDVVVNAATQ